MAIKFKPGERQYSNVLYKKLRKTWYDMIQRCENPKHHSYKYYGAKGVTVCEEWKTLDGFLNTVDSVDGWDEELYKITTMHLDKDLKYPGNMVYSPETCMFVTPEENRKPTHEAHMKDCKAISPTGETYVFRNREEFCRLHNLNPCNVYFCLIGKNRQHKGWRFEYLDGTTPKNNSNNRGKTKVAIDPDGKKYKFVVTSKFAKEHGLNAAMIGKVLNGKADHHRNWKFYIEE